MFSVPFHDNGSVWSGYISWDMSLLIAFYHPELPLLTLSNHALRKLIKLKHQIKHQKHKCSQAFDFWFLTWKKDLIQNGKIYRLTGPVLFCLWTAKDLHNYLDKLIDSFSCYYESWLDRKTIYTVLESLEQSMTKWNFKSDQKNKSMEA